ncbi:MAG: AAA family ATPase [Deltaproteobacteria bacterium]|nr:AAA family ATPase [Deltaproteobacteria bacterium]
MFKRIQSFQGLNKESCFLWGPRQTGKSTLLARQFPDSKIYDLLLADEFERLNRNPSLLREELLQTPPSRPVIIDEVQKIPPLLDEVQWLIVNKNISFILCGSSARKLKKSGANLLGGRALRYELYPLVFPEIPDFDLIRALNHGLLPRHYLHKEPLRLVQAYVGEYLRQEIAQEGIVRNLPSFGRFLEAAAFSNAEIPVYKNIASECGISPPTAKEYFQILEDTLLGRFLPVFQKRPKRRVVQSPKFYFFDVGVINFLLKRGKITEGSESFGKAFEHFLFQELSAHSHYSGKFYPISYWRTTSQQEVDFILGDHEIAIEVKGTSEATSHHCKGLKAFTEEYTTKRRIVVSCDKNPRKFGSIEILPWRNFLQMLWGGEII